MTTQDTANIVLVHLGQHSLPAHLMEMIAGTISVAPQSTITLIADSAHQHTIEHAFVAKGFTDRVTFVSTESITPSQTTQEFRTITPLDRSFRDGFWLYASERFLVLADFLESRLISNCLHLENDVQLYFDPTDKLSALQNFASFAVPLDRNRAIPGVVWIRTPEVARTLAMHISIAGGIDDMMSVGKFCSERTDLSSAFPTMPEAYLLDRGLDINRYGNGLAAFGGIFDAAAIGQFLGGIHWLNNPEDTRFFLNESSDLNMTDFDFSWNVQNGLRQPCISYLDHCTPILAIHVHSKNMRGFSSNNTGVSDTSNDIITGERLQAMCDLTISSSQVTAFHGRDKIQSGQFIELPEKIEGRFFKKTKTIIPPGEDFLNVCRAARTIFVYTHLLDYFEKYVAPRLHNSFVLVTHNSDDGVGLSRLGLLNHPNLVAWYAQNVHVQHSKLYPLPIGMANSQWGTDRVNFLFQQSRHLKKSKLVYANFSTVTHPSRVSALSAAQSCDGVTIQSGVSFEDYVVELSKHKFCLCPRGNGLDTHRFWEAQYLDCIPIIVKDDWIAAYSGLPVLVLDSWASLKSTNLNEMYVRITTTAFDRRSLSLSHYKSQIRNESNTSIY
jgi:hypothetical protein